MSCLLMILPSRNKKFLSLISPEIFHVRCPSFSKHDTRFAFYFPHRSSNFVSATNCSFVCGWWENPNQRFQRSKWRKHSDHQVQPWHIVVLNMSIFHPNFLFPFFWSTSLCKHQFPLPSPSQKHAHYYLDSLAHTSCEHQGMCPLRAFTLSMTPSCSPRTWLLRWST